ncbi:MAG: hypothetical protein JXR16_14025 [Bermanella sp.]
MAMKQIACAAIPLLMAALPTQAITVEQLNKQVQQMNKRIAEQDNKLRINGFASFGLVQSDNEDAYHRGITDEANFRRYTKAGIQMTFNIDDSTSVITQLVSKGENDFDTKADWLYLKHSFGNGLSAKVGRLRKPNYMLSEFFDVGYAMPWTQPPVEVYGVLEDSANFEAVDLTYDFEIGDWSAYTQVQYGRSQTETAISKDLIAFNFSMNNGNLTLRAGYSQADADLIAGTDLAATVTAVNGALALTDKTAEQINGAQKGVFYGLAAMYDDGNLVIMGEFNSLTVDTIFPDQDGYYLMGGYRIGQWMPYLTFAHAETTDDDTRDATVSAVAVDSYVNNVLGVADGDAAYAATVAATSAAAAGGIASAQAEFDKEQDRTALGVRYDWKPGVAIKVQYDMVDTGDTIGEFDSFPADSKANILSITIDTVF